MSRPKVLVPRSAATLCAIAGLCASIGLVSRPTSAAPKATASVQQPTQLAISSAQNSATGSRSAAAQSLGPVAPTAVTTTISKNAGSPSVKTKTSSTKLTTTTLTKSRVAKPSTHKTTSQKAKPTGAKSTSAKSKASTSARTAQDSTATSNTVDGSLISLDNGTVTQLALTPTTIAAPATSPATTTTAATTPIATTTTTTTIAAKPVTSTTVAPAVTSTSVVALASTTTGPTSQLDYDYKLRVTPPTQKATPGSDLTVIVVADPVVGSLKPITVIPMGLPVGVSASISQNPMTTAAQLTVSVPLGLAPGTYEFKLNGQSNGLQRTVSVGFVIDPPPTTTTTTTTTTLPPTTTTTIRPFYKYSIVTTSPTNTLVRGGSAAFTITVTRQAGNTDKVALSATDLPKNVSAGFSTYDVGTDPVTMWLSSSEVLVAGTYTFNLIVSSAGLSQTLPLQITLA